MPSKPTTRRSALSTKVVAFSCLHAPNHNADAVDAAVERVASLKPQVVVCLGDLFEAASASVHPNEVDHDLLEEFEIGAGILDRFREAAPKAKLVWCLGNHDDNLQARDTRRVARDLRRAIAWNNSRWADSFRAWAQLPYSKGPECIFRVGQVMFWHGFDCGHASDSLETLQMAWASGGFAWALGVRGHTHRPIDPTQIMRTPRVPLPYFATNVGTLGPLKPEWAKREDTSMWGPALLEVDARPGDPFRMRGKCWDAHLHRL